jgi:CheY-specific phosphatase CheX
MGMDTDQLIAFHFLQGVTESVNTMAGFSLQEAKEASDQDLNEIMSSMLVTGERNALLSISTSKGSASILTAYMTGSDIDQIDEGALTDGICELVNMAAGFIKAKLSEHEKVLALSSPFSYLGSGSKIIIKRYVKRFEHLLISDQVQLKVHIYFI